MKFEQVETGHWRLGDIGLELGRGEDARSGTARPSGNELINNAFGLTEHLKVGCGVDVRTRCGIGATDDHRLAARAAKLDQPQRVSLLRQHSARKHKVSPGKI